MLCKSISSSAVVVFEIAICLDPDLEYLKYWITKTRAPIPRMVLVKGSFNVSHRVLGRATEGATGTGATVRKPHTLYRLYTYDAIINYHEIALERNYTSCGQSTQSGYCA